MRTIPHLLTLAFLSLVPGGAHAQAGDIPGAKDHPEISRFAGSAIVQYDQSDFGELVIPLSDQPHSPEAKSERVEGRLTKFLYRLPENASSHQVFRAYESELSKAGFKALYRCSGLQCGPGWPSYAMSTYELRDRGEYFGMQFMDFESQRYLAAKREAADGDTYALLYTFEIPPPHGTKYAMLTAVDRAPLKEGLVTVGAEQMARDIANQGHVAVYGVYFDTDKAEIRAESRAALEEMVKLLKQNPTLNVFIVGHTDNVGTVSHNMDLSQRRAGAVVKALVSDYGGDAKRVLGFGVGPLAPVVSNDSEAGRAKNRRVELVKR